MGEPTIMASYFVRSMPRFASTVSVSKPAAVKWVAMCAAISAVEPYLVP